MAVDDQAASGLWELRDEARDLSCALSFDLICEFCALRSRSLYEQPEEVELERAPLVDEHVKLIRRGDRIPLDEVYVQRHAQATCARVGKREGDGVGKRGAVRERADARQASVSSA